MRDFQDTRCDRGFTLVETLLALCLTLLMIGAGLAVVVVDSALVQAPPQAMDVQQRARAAMLALRSDLSLAGAGIDDGPLSGPLASRLATIVPRRVGVTDADPVTAARPDVVTIMYVPEGVAAATLRAPLSGQTPALSINGLPDCPRGQALCGLSAGTSVLIYDDTGRHALYAVADASGTAASLRALQGLSPAFASGAVVVPIETKTYYLDAGNHQLRVYDGDASDAPVVDDVVDARFEYFGDWAPPTFPKPPDGVANCLYDASGARLPSVALTTASEALTPLPLSLFEDGPFCGDGDRRFDADLLRIRAVHLTVRVQAGTDRFRSAAAFSLLGGINRTPATLVPDLVLGVDVTPRNLNVGR